MSDPINQFPTPTYRYTEQGAHPSMRQFHGLPLSGLALLNAVSGPVYGAWLPSSWNAAEKIHIEMVADEIVNLPLLMQDMETGDWYFTGDLPAAMRFIREDCAVTVTTQSTDADTPTKGTVYRVAIAYDSLEGDRGADWMFAAAEWGVGPTQEIAMRFALGAAFGPVDSEYTGDRWLQAELDKRQPKPAPDEDGGEYEGEDSSTPLTDWIAEPDISGVSDASDTYNTTEYRVAATAYSLLGDGQGNEWQDNVEYTRAVCEMAFSLSGMTAADIDPGSSGFIPFMLGHIRAVALS